MAEHRRPAIPFTDAPRGTCRWCGTSIVHESGERKGEPNRRRRWHQDCVDTYNASDPRELRKRIRRRDRGRCASCGLDTVELKRRMKGRGMWKRLQERGFVRRRSLWELDHIVPLIEGGGHEASNLQTLCVPCHRKKSAGETRDRAARAQKGRTESLEQEIDHLLDRVDAANARIAQALNGPDPPLSGSGEP